MLLVRLPVDSRLSVVKFWGELKIKCGLLTVRGSVPPTLSCSRVNCILFLLLLFLVLILKGIRRKYTHGGPLYIHKCRLRFICIWISQHFSSIILSNVLRQKAYNSGEGKAAAVTGVNLPITMLQNICPESISKWQERVLFSKINEWINKQTANITSDSFTTFPCSEVGEAHYPMPICIPHQHTLAFLA